MNRKRNITMDRYMRNLICPNTVNILWDILKRWNLAKLIIKVEIKVSNVLKVKHNTSLWENGITSQYLVCPPCALMTAVQRRYMEWMRRLIKAIGTWAHTLRNAWRSSAAVVGLGRTSFSRLWISSHRCSMGFKSGQRAGHFMIVVPLCWRKSPVALAVWGRAWSC